MAAPQTERKPGFFWQGVLILLPVTVLAVVSIVSLRQDERAAEQDARNRAVENVQSLARAMRSSADGELHRYLTLQDDWMAGLRLMSRPEVSTVFPDAKLKADIAHWEQEYPGLKLAEVAMENGEALANGQRIKPPDYPAVPEPPQWYRELSPEQKTLWEALRAIEPGKMTKAEFNSRKKAFFDSKPSTDATEAAGYLSYSLNLSFPPLNQAPQETESGISFQDIACYRMLSAPRVELSGMVLNTVWQQMFENPSFMSSRLLELSEGLTNRAGAAWREKVGWMRRYWEAETESAEGLDMGRDLSWNPAGWSQWTRDGERLAIFQAMIFENKVAGARDAVLSVKGYEVWFVPRAVVSAIFLRAIAENQFLIPEYTTPVLTIKGMLLHTHAGTPVIEDKDLLGSAKETAGSWLAQAAISFDVKFVLMSREQMLAAERRRERLFVWLILGTVFTALAGLLAARRAFRRQLQLNEMKSNFVSSVSHELRAPIASVRLMAENLEHGKVPEAGRQNEYFRFIVQECRRLSSLIENVLDFSRIEQGRKQYEFEPTDLLALTQTTVKLMSPYAAEKGVRLEMPAIQNDVPNLEANVDGRAIQQALVNLIDNAIKHSAKGQTVEIRNEKLKVKKGDQPEDANLDAEVIRLSVTDQGPGIPAGEREKIFERFYRRGSELRRETQGVGIGLSIVKHIVEAHEGRVMVESEPGRGSRFTIELPVKK